MSIFDIEIHFHRDFPYQSPKVYLVVTPTDGSQPATKDKLNVIWQPKMSIVELLNEVEKELSVVKLIDSKYKSIKSLNESSKSSKPNSLQLTKTNIQSSRTLRRKDVMSADGAPPSYKTFTQQ